MWEPKFFSIIDAFKKLWTCNSNTIVDKIQSEKYVFDILFSFFSDRYKCWYGKLAINGSSVKLKSKQQELNGEVYIKQTIEQRNKYNPIERWT